MASTLAYTPDRHNAMQAILWALLLAVVGLAALVDRQVGSVARPNFGPELVNGSLHFRLPSGWVVALHSRVSPLVVALAVEGRSPAPGVPPRTIAVYRQRVARLMSAEQYLERTGLLEDIFGDGNEQAEPARLAGWPALRVVGQTVTETDDGTAAKSEMVICALFPNRQAVTVRLSKFGDFSPADAALLDQVAAAMKMDGVGSPPGQ